MFFNLSKGKSGIGNTLQDQALKRWQTASVREGSYPEGDLDEFEGVKLISGKSGSAVGSVREPSQLSLGDGFAIDNPTVERGANASAPQGRWHVGESLAAGKNGGEENWRVDDRYASDDQTVSTTAQSKIASIIARNKGVVGTGVAACNAEVDAIRGGVVCDSEAELMTSTSSVSADRASLLVGNGREISSGLSVTPAESVAKAGLRVIPGSVGSPTRGSAIKINRLDETTAQVKVAAVEQARPTIAGPADYSIQVDEDLKRRFGNNIRSALGVGSVIEGKMSFESPVRIDGTINGEISSTSALIVGEQAEVNARLRVGSIIVLGVVTGDIDALELVEIRRGGRLEGDVITKRIVIEEGGFFEGRCSTPTPS